MGMTSGITSYLPVPEISEDNLKHSVKQPHKSDDYLKVRKPPKLNPKHHHDSNRSLNSSLPLVISFKDSSGVNDDLLSPLYNKLSSESYYDQCFDTISKIGEGSFGEVFKVRNKEDGLLYAVKKSKQFFRSESYRQERLEEVRRYEQFSNHEHCVTLYRAWEQDDRLYMQMELCQGSLENYLSKKRHIPEEQIWCILLDLLLALKCLHDRNLIHLDIKLDNILIGDDGLCKLGDFGLVVDVNHANLFQTTEGDSRYIAPELMQGYFSKAADIFSLGIAILELSCNLELPPNGPLWQQLRSGILPEEFIKQISPELREVIRSMMEPDPKQRPNVDQLLAHKKLVMLRQKRKREILKKVKQSYRKVTRFLWSKMCNLKNIIYTLLLYIITGFKIKKEEQDPNDSFKQNFLNGSHVQDSSNVSFYDSHSKIINSTPLNHHAVSFRRLRKDLTKTSFGSDSLSNAYGSSHSFVGANRRSSAPTFNYETSTLICKKLTFKSDDSD